MELRQISSDAVAELSKGLDSDDRYVVVGALTAVARHLHESAEDTMMLRRHGDGWVARNDRPGPTWLPGYASSATAMAVAAWLDYTARALLEAPWPAVRYRAPHASAFVVARRYLDGLAGSPPPPGADSVFDLDAPPTVG